MYNYKSTYYFNTKRDAVNQMNLLNKQLENTAHLIDIHDNIGIKYEYEIIHDLYIVYLTLDIIPVIKNKI